MKKLVFVLLCLFLSIPCYARTITINADGTGDYTTVQAAIDDANDGDVIILSQGTYTGDGNRDIDFLGKAITVRSTEPNKPSVVADTIIDCQGNSSSKHRGFYFHSGEDSNSVLEGLTIMNGYGPVENVAGLDRSAGGAIFSNESSPLVRNCIIVNNKVSHEGGGICCLDSSMMIIKCRFNGNLSAQGGAIATLDNSNPTIKHCFILSNSATYNGGGIYCRSSYPEIINCEIASNLANVGGGLCSNDANPTISLSTITKNSVTYRGGGIYAQLGIVEVNNSILWDDSAPNGSELFGDFLVSYCCVEGAWAGEGNIDTNPCFIDPDSDDFQLLPHSPCINAGDPQYPYDPNQTDINDRPRIIGGRIDMGAYEFNPNTPPAAVAGPDKEVYAWIDGIADVNLDGSASYDDDGDPLTYLWSWEIEPNIYDTNGVSPTIELPVGEHIIELVVNDGIDDSEPNCTTMTVIGPLHSFLRILPRTINHKSNQRHIMAWLRLPAGITRDDIDPDVPLTLYPGDIEASRQFIFQNDRYNNPGAFILAFFNKQDLMNAIPDNGPVQLEVVGQLKTGRYFFGQRTVRIINPPHRHPRRPWRH